MIIVDVGACTGEYTDHCFSNYDVERVIMVEPLEQNLEYLSYKYSQNETLGKKTSIIAGAISDYSGVGHLYPKIKFDRITNPEEQRLIALLLWPNGANRNRRDHDKQCNGNCQNW